MLVLSRFVVELDHDSPAVRLHEPESSATPDRAARSRSRIEDNNPYTTATLTLRDGKEVTARMVIDTGAAGSIAYLSRSFAAAAPAGRARLGSRLRQPGTEGMPAGALRAGSAGCGAAGGPPIPGAWIRRQNGARRHDRGRVSAALQGVFRLRRSRMILEPNSRYAGAFALRRQRTAGTPGGQPCRTQCGSTRCCRRLRRPKPDCRRRT